MAAQDDMSAAIAKLTDAVTAVQAKVAEMSKALAGGDTQALAAAAAQVSTIADGINAIVSTATAPPPTA